MADVTPLPTPNSPFWADKSFILVVLNVAALIVSPLLGIDLNVETLSADVALVASFVIGNKAKSGAALVALIKAKAAERYVKPEAPAPQPPQA